MSLPEVAKLPVAAQMRPETVQGSATSAAAPRKSRRWRRRLLVAAALCLFIAVFHAPLFRLLASGLVVDDPLTKTDAVVFAGKNGPFAQIPVDEVAELYRDGAVSKVILIEDTSSRIVKQGILPTLDSVVRHDLATRGVPDSAITTLKVEGRGDRDTPEQLQRWLREHPGSTVTVLQPELSSRAGRLILRRALTPEELSRVHLHALSDPRYNAGNWWHTRRGVTELVTCYIALAHTFLIDQTDQPALWDADEFESGLKKN